MTTLRTRIREHLPPATVESLRAIRHASAQGLVGADLYHLRVELEQSIEHRLQQSEAVQHERLLLALRDQLRRELDAELERRTQELMDRLDVLFGAWSRIVSTLEDRIDVLERRETPADTEVNGHVVQVADNEAAGSPVPR
ncbi:MAG: hypothetical protein JOZ75_09295 [Candidatus Dormibacteraeota bacterium]|nr:hypothetical protein [Candidatus Dormibacteraeota bacterium]